MDVVVNSTSSGRSSRESCSASPPQQLDEPTPCAGFTVRDVLEHMIGGATVFAAAFRRELAGDPDTSDVLGSVDTVLGALARSIQRPGALDRTIHAPFGDVPGVTFAGFVALDGLVHGWDLAKATGQQYDPPDDLVAAVEQFAHDSLERMRDGTMFGPAVEAPAAATRMERLVAFTGRQP